MIRLCLYGTLVFALGLVSPRFALATPRAMGAPSLPGFSQVETGPWGGTIWQGQIPNEFVTDHRLADIYLPPGFSPTTRYPVIYFLHGFWGSPSSFVDGMQLPATADGLIHVRGVPSFIAVMPPGGPIQRSQAANGEWAGVWENYVVRDVVPWVDAHLPTDPTQRTLAGLSAGGFGAVDIGLRHPGLFRTLESWGGYFQPFRDGPFRHTSADALADHDPVVLVRSEARQLRAHGMRFFLSTGRSGHGSVKARWTFDFAGELSALHLKVKLWVLPPAETGHLWRTQLPDAITYSLSGS